MTEVLSLAHLHQLVISKDPNIHYYCSHLLHNAESLKFNLNIHSQFLHTQCRQEQRTTKEKDSPVNVTASHNHTEKHSKVNRLSAAVISRVQRGPRHTAAQCLNFVIFLQSRTRRLQPNRAPLGRYGEGGSRRIRRRRGDQNRILEAIPRWRGARGFVQQQQHQEKGGGFGGEERRRQERRRQQEQKGNSTSSMGCVCLVCVVLCCLLGLQLLH